MSSRIRFFSGRGGFGAARACRYFPVGHSILGGDALIPGGLGRTFGGEAFKTVAVMVVAVVGGWWSSTPIVDGRVAAEGLRAGFAGMKAALAERGKVLAADGGKGFF